MVIEECKVRFSRVFSEGEMDRWIFLPMLEEEGQSLMCTGKGKGVCVQLQLPAVQAEFTLPTEWYGYAGIARLNEMRVRECFPWPLLCRRCSQLCNGIPPHPVACMGPPNTNFTK
jgi:hypothetical protein